MPKALYGKNAKPDEAPHTFFAHYYGSSWHADDAAFIGFLGKWGKILMWVGLVILVLGILRMALGPHAKKRKYGLRRIGAYDVLLPRWRSHNGRWYLDIGQGWFTLPSSNAPSPQPASPVSLTSDDEDDVHLLPLALESRSTSPTLSEASSFPDSNQSSLQSLAQPFVDGVRRASQRLRSYWGGESDYTPLPSSLARRPSQSQPHSRRRSRSVLFFMPAVATPSHHVELSAARSQSRTRPHSRAATGSESEYPPDKPTYTDDDDYDHAHLQSGPAPDSSASRR